MAQQVRKVKRQHHQRVLARAEVRDMDQKKRQFLATILTYNTLDDYNTEFDPNIFTASLAARVPRICWAHDWSDLIGVTAAYDNTPKKLDVVGQLSDFDAVPRAKQAWAQMEDGTIDQFSVGFWLLAEAKSKNFPGATLLMEGQLDEFSPVLAGAVQGTSLNGLRGSGQLVMLRNKAGEPMELWVPADQVARLAAKLSIGDLDLADFLGAVKGMALTPDKVQAASEEDDEDEPGDGDEPGDQPNEDENDDKPDDSDDEPVPDSDGDDIDVDQLEADLDAALSHVG